MDIYEISPRFAAAAMSFNIIAQAVLFNTIDADAFEPHLLVRETRVKEQHLDHWRNMGPIGKLYNTLAVVSLDTSSSPT